MWPVLFQLLFGVAVTAAIVAVIYNWDDIRESVANWLRRNNLSKSALMDVWIRFDKILSSIKVRLFAKTRQTGVQEIKETSVSLQQLKEEDPDVYAELQRRGLAEKHILNQVT